MTTEYKGIPAGAPAIIPRLVCRDVEAQIDFCRETFGAVEGVRRPGPDGHAVHAMLLFGPSMLMLEAVADAPEPGATEGWQLASCDLRLRRECDATVKRAVARGATLVTPVETQFWGDRIGWVLDPSGHMWTVATRVEATSEKQRQERWSSIRSTSD